MADNRALHKKSVNPVVLKTTGYKTVAYFGSGGGSAALGISQITRSPLRIFTHNTCQVRKKAGINRSFSSISAGETGGSVLFAAFCSRQGDRDAMWMCFADTSTINSFETPNFTTGHQGLLCGHFWRTAAFCSCACYLCGDTLTGYCGSVASNSGTLSPTGATSDSLPACCVAPTGARRAVYVACGTACESKDTGADSGNRAQTSAGKTDTAF